MPCYQICIRKVFLLIIWSVPYKIVQGIFLDPLFRCESTQPSMHQQILFFSHCKLLIQIEILQKIQHFLPHLRIQRPEFPDRRIHFLDGKICDFLTEKPQTFQRHHLMVPDDAERIRHFHQFQYHLNRMLPPVQDIPQNIERICIFQLDFFQQLHKSLILTVNIRNNVSSHKQNPPFFIHTNLHTFSITSLSYHTFCFLPDKLLSLLFFQTRSNTSSIEISFMRNPLFLILYHIYSFLH